MMPQYGIRVPLNTDMHGPTSPNTLRLENFLLVQNTHKRVFEHHFEHFDEYNNAHELWLAHLCLD